MRSNVKVKIQLCNATFHFQEVKFQMLDFANYSATEFEKTAYCFESDYNRITMPRIESVIKGRHAYEVELKIGDVFWCGLEQLDKGLAVTVETDDGKIVGHAPTEYQMQFRGLIQNGIKIKCTILANDDVAHPEYQFEKGEGVQRQCVYGY